MPPKTDLDQIDRDYVENLFYETLNSIRYSRDKYNPAYYRVEDRVKRQTTRSLRLIAERAAVHFNEMCRANGDQAATQEGVQESIERALDELGLA
jgi:hypothetical protein